MNEDLIIKFATCNYCNKELIPPNQIKYCSRSCSTLSSKNRLGTGKIHKCRVCNIDIPKRRTYCNDHIQYDKIITNLSVAKTDRTRRKILIEKYGASCWKCMLDKWMDLPIPIELDHIDGNPGNNDESNLRLLCLNCHAQTDTWKNKQRLITDPNRKPRNRK